MAVKIRLTRGGSKKHPFYRIVATDSRVARDGSFLERIGTYNPQDKGNELSLKGELLEKWLKVGATPSTTVANLIAKAKKEAK